MENTQIGPFLVLEKIGTNRRDKVYHARQTEQDRDVALKFLKLPSDIPVESALPRIHHEAQIIKRLDHPNVVRLYGAGIHEQQVFFANELVDGETLYAILRRRGRLAADQVIDLGAQIANALDFLHQNELVHNNLSTEKVIVDADGQIKLMDVRLNRSGKRRWDAPKRATPETAAYMSPEHLLGEGTNSKSDVYSLGVLLYEMLTGKLPYDPKTIGLLVRDKQENRAVHVTQHVANCPAWLARLVMQMIQAQPAKRPHSAKAVALTLEQIRTVDQSQSAAAVEMTRGFSALSAGKDRNEARKVLGKKTRKKNKSAAGPLTQSLPFLAVGLSLVSVVIGITLAVNFWPESKSGADKMAQADKLMTSAAPEDWRKARKIYQRLAESSDSQQASVAEKKYRLSRRKSMLHRLDNGVTGLDKVEIREFYRGFELQKQHNAEGALAFFQKFVAEYDMENRQRYVYDEARERLDALIADKSRAMDVKADLDQALDQADQLATKPETLAQAHKIWDDVIDQHASNDFLMPQVQRAETGKAMHPPEKNASGDTRSADSGS